MVAQKEREPTVRNLVDIQQAKGVGTYFLHFFTAACFMFSTHYATSTMNKQLSISV